MKWDYEDDLEPGKVDIVKVCAELNGYNCADGSLLLNFTQLQDDGSTACGNWIYSGYYNSYEGPALPAADQGEGGNRHQPELGLRLAAKPAHRLQPLLGRPRRQSLESGAAAGMVGRRRLEDQ